MRKAILRAKSVYSYEPYGFARLSSYVKCFSSMAAAHNNLRRRISRSVNFEILSNAQRKVSPGWIHGTQARWLSHPGAKGRQVLDEVGQREGVRN
jgi:hypothetical protein